MRHHIYLTSLSVAMAFFFASCLSSVSTQLVKQEGMSNEQKGRDILHKAWENQGMNNLSNHTVYEVVATDHWHGLLGRMAKVWPDAKSRIKLKYRVGSFDGQVAYLNGKQEGGLSGIQSWKYYHQNEGEELEFVKTKSSREFGISAFQYFFELADRLKAAPLITYAGETELRGESYDLVFVTWEKLKSHKEHDQYLVWVNKKTGVLEFCEFTIHDPFLPGGSMLPGSIEFTDFRNIDGVNIPFSQYIYLGSPKKKTSKNLHEFHVESFSFDTFDPRQLSPNQDLPLMGDEK